MNNRLNDTLCSVGHEVFESLAFILSAFEQEPESQDDSLGEARTTGTISFKGPFDGTVALSVSSELLPEICANMLGLDFDEVAPADQQRDAFKELLNVICGNLLPKLAGEEAVFDVETGYVLCDRGIPEAVGELPSIAVAQLQLEGGWAEMALFAPQCVIEGLGEAA